MPQQRVAWITPQAHAAFFAATVFAIRKIEQPGLMGPADGDAYDVFEHEVTTSRDTALEIIEDTGLELRVACATHAAYTMRRSMLARRFLRTRPMSESKRASPKATRPS